MVSIKKKKQELMEQMVRNAIYNSVIEILNTRGLKSLTVSRVARKADIATGTFYNYFRDKDELLAYTTERILSQVILMMEEIAHSNAPSDQKLVGVIEAVFNFCSDNVRIFKFLEQDRSFTKIELSKRRKKVQQITDILAELISQGIENECFRKTDPNKIAELIHSSMVGIIHVKPDLDRFDPQEDARQLSEVIFTFLKKNGTEN